MSNSPSENSHPANTGINHLWLMILSRGGLGVGALLLLGIIFGVWRLRSFVYQELVPLASQNLTTTLNRPVKLGAVKSFSLTGVQFAASEIPPTPTDPDRANIKAVDVGFDIWQLITNRNLRLDVTLINPDVYIEQDSQGRWLTTTIAPSSGKALIKTDLDKLRFRDANLVLVPKVHEGEKLSLPVPVGFAGINGTTQLLNENNLIKLDLAGKTVSGGNISITGDLIPQKTLAGDFRLQGQNLLAADITRIVTLPLTLQTGKVNGDLRIKVIPKQKTLLYGSATMEKVTVQIPKLPQLLNHSQGNLSFNGLVIKLDNIVTSYGQIPLRASGTIDQQAGFNLKGRVNAVSLANAQTTLKVKLPFPVRGIAQADLRLIGAITKPVLSGNVRTLKTARIDQVDFGKVSSKFELISSQSLLKITDIQSKTTYGGDVKGAGIIQLGKVSALDFRLRAENVPGDAIAQVYNIKTGFPIGLMTATAEVKGAANDTHTIVKWQAPQAKYPATGIAIINPDRTVSFRDVVANVGGGIINGSGIYNHNNKSWQALTQANRIKLTAFVDQKQQENISLVGAKFNGGLQLSGNSSPFQIKTIIPDNANVNIAGGQVNISQIKLQDQNFTALLLGKDLRLGTILKQANPILNNPLAGNFMITGNRENFSLKTFSGIGEAFLSIGRGTIKAANIQVEEGRYQAKIQANNVPLTKLVEAQKLRPEMQGMITGQLQVAGSVESFQPETIQGSGKGRFKLSSGTVTASEIQLNNGNYQALLTTSGLQLNPFNPQLKGQLGGKLQVSGILAAPKLADVAAVGQVRFSQGLGGIDSPIQADIGWNGEKLTIDGYNNANISANSSTTSTTLSTSALTIKGYLLTNARKADIPEITDVNFQIQAKNYNLERLPVPLPDLADVSGGLDFSGQVIGKPTAPNIIGKLGLRNLKVQKFAFEPLLIGNVNAVSGRGLSLDVTGVKDSRGVLRERIAFNLDGNNRPQSFFVQWRQALLSGAATGSNWGINIDNFPLKSLNIALPANTPLSPGDVRGLLTGKLQINSQTFSTAGNIAIEKPELGRIKGDRFTTQLRYNNNTFILGDSEFRKGESRYTFDANIKPWTKKPQLRAKINIDKGNIQDILTAAQIFDIQDFQRGLNAPTYGKATDLTTYSQGLPLESLLTQIQRLSEIDALLTAQQQQRIETKPVPELRDLKGILDGNISINTATTDEPRIKFDLQGQNFTWGKPTEPTRFYSAEEVIVKGSFAEGIYRLQPLRIQAQQKIIAFTGSIGGKEQSGKLKVENFPIQRLNNLVKLPLGITGKLNVNAAISGSISNPQARGELNITDGTIDKKPVESANASFSYANGRLNFGSQVLGVGAEPANISGSIPYTLPFASEKSNSDQVTLDVNIKNEGLTLLNLFTNDIFFEKGQGELDLKVRGTRRQPFVKGIAALNNATFSAQALPGKLTNVNGNAIFDLTRVFIKSLEGKFSNGNIKAVGELPIFDNPNLKIDVPLTVDLQQLLLNLKGLYQGGANGNLAITGSLLKPIIGGHIELFNGQVLLTESPDNNSSSSKINNQNKTDPENRITRLNNLELKLGRNIQISKPPVFKFQAAGDLIVNGSLAEPIPEGTIKLTKGAVNLFTTQLNLARGYKHTATFSARQPRDPNLDIRLFAKVLDITQNSDLSRQGSLGLAGLETVRVEASIDGLGSQINDNLQLKSNPSRSQTQIVTLLGGGFVDNQGRGDSSLGLINIAGSAVFSNFQGAFNEIGDAFGLSELRIFPTILAERPEAGRNNSSLELALEAGIDISPKFSLSTIKILTAGDPLQWGINYRINNQFRVRSSTNLTNDSRAVIEFERRF
ncbi:MAG: translocation/assembly module TamB domain-containing protein [Nostocales cyanobacterium ELA583]